jgi:hypothetical protein
MTNKETAVPTADSDCAALRAAIESNMSLALKLTEMRAWKKHLATFDDLFVRAALKAQPAPTEAQSELTKRASTSGDFTGMIRVDSTMTREQALAAVMRTAQGEDSARLSIPVSAYLWLMGAGGDAFAQPLRSGSFWWRDTFNKLAGVDMMEVIRQDRARASAETGGVKS